MIMHYDDDDNDDDDNDDDDNDDDDVCLKNHNGHYDIDNVWISIHYDNVRSPTS